MHAGKKSTALVVDAGASDRYDQPSSLGFFNDHEPARAAAAFQRRRFDPHITPTTAAENEQTSLQQPVHTLIAARYSKLRRVGSTVETQTEFNNSA